ncbi:hypothetical protein [Streptomyces noursei]
MPSRTICVAPDGIPHPGSTTSHDFANWHANRECARTPPGGTGRPRSYNTENVHGWSSHKSSR